ncbi:MFS transporter, partial [Corynebacterium bovis]
SARGPLLGLGLVIVGMVVASLSARHITVWNTVVVAVILGAAYGLCLISGLTEVQRIAGPDDLGGLTAVYYVVTYIGFFFPMILTKLGDWFTYPVMLGFGVVMAVLAFIVVAVNSRRHLPAAD